MLRVITATWVVETKDMGERTKTELMANTVATAMIDAIRRITKDESIPFEMEEYVERLQLVSLEEAADRRRA